MDQRNPDRRSLRRPHSRLPCHNAGLVTYKLTDKNTLISFSGGRTSGYMLYQILKANDGLPITAKVVFANTGREMPETLDFVRDCQVSWGIDISWLEYDRVDNKVAVRLTDWKGASRNGEPFDKYLAGNMLPNVFRRACTQELKVKTLKRYLVSLGWKQWINTIGIRADEQRRLKPSKDKRWENWYPLADANADKFKVMQFWKSQKFDLKIIPGAGNCDGCFLKSEATLSAMFREYPERMAWWSDWETKKGRTFHETRTYKELGSFVDRQGDWIFDDEAYLCQQDDGECTG